MAGLAFLLQAFLGSSAMIDTFGGAGLRGQERRLNKGREVMIQREGLSVLEAKSETRAAEQNAKQASWRADFKSVASGTSGATAGAETGTGLAVGEPDVDVHVEVIILPAPADDEEPARADAPAQPVVGVGSGATGPRGATGMEEAPTPSGVSPIKDSVLTSRAALPPGGKAPAADVIPSTRMKGVRHDLCGISLMAHVEARSVAQDCVENPGIDGYTQRNVVAADVLMMMSPAKDPGDIITSVTSRTVNAMKYEMILHTKNNPDGPNLAKVTIAVENQLGAGHDPVEVKMGSGDECVVDGGSVNEPIQRGGTTGTCAIAMLHYRS